ncbi:MAG: TIGR04086 family membrane protein [Firmicutes bacterium]|nr:TIGR04086 family membrane protein [Bacillota bacterium]
MAWRTGSIGSDQGPQPTTLTFVRSLVRGVMASGAVAICGAVLVSLVQLIGGWDVQVSGVFQIFSYLSMATGGFVAARSNQQSGWLVGGLVGISFILVINWFTVGAPLPMDISSTVALRLGVAFLVGAIGGVMGVNS